MLNRNNILGFLSGAKVHLGVEIPPGLCDEEIDAFGGRFGIIVPEDLREWLKISNGVLIGRVLLGIGKPGRDIEEIASIFSEWREKGWIPIASDGCGNYYVLSTRREFGPGFPVVFIDTQVFGGPDEGFGKGKSGSLVASDIGHFLEFFLEEQLLEMAALAPRESRKAERDAYFNWENQLSSRWPFGKDFVLARDPDILKFRKDLLPWEIDKHQKR